MKKNCLLLCSAIMIGIVLCSCSGNEISQKASEAIADLEKSMTEAETQSATKRKLETAAYTDAPEETTSENMHATEWEDMIDDGEVSDGDGNVGDRENDDGDGNVDNGAVG